MSGLPRGWVEARLGELGSWQGGGTPDKSNAAYWTGGSIPWVSPKDMKRFHISEAEDQITEAALAGSSGNLVAENSVLLVTRSSILKHTLPVALTGRDVAINQDIKALTPHPGLDPLFIAKQIKSLGPFVLKNCTKAGTTVDSVDFERLKAVPANIPPPAEQKRIVAKLDALSAKSARARTELARIETLVSRYKQAVLSKAFSGELTSEWRRQNNSYALNQDDVLQTRRDWLASQGLKAIQVSVTNVSEDKVPFAVPNNWSWFTAEGLNAPITKGTTPAKENMSAGTGVIPFIKVYNLTFDSTLDFSRDPTFVSQDTHCKELKRSIVKPGDVLMNIVGPPLGKVSIVPDDWPEWNVNQAIAIFRPLAVLNNRYLALWLLSASMLSWAKRDSKATAGQSNLTLELCRGIPVPTCHIEEQREIVRRIESAFAKIDRLANEAKRALELVGRLDEAIIAKAFCGELVPQDENDEPAEYLLARIRAEREAAPKARRGRSAKG